jgi:hypothetical protein
MAVLRPARYSKIPGHFSQPSRKYPELVNPEDTLLLATGERRAMIDIAALQSLQSAALSDREDYSRYPQATSPAPAARRRHVQYAKKTSLTKVWFGGIRLRSKSWAILKKRPAPAPAFLVRRGDGNTHVILFHRLHESNDGAEA